MSRQNKKQAQLVSRAADVRGITASASKSSSRRLRLQMAVEAQPQSGHILLWKLWILSVHVQMEMKAPLRIMKSTLRLNSRRTSRRTLLRLQRLQRLQRQHVQPLHQIHVAFAAMALNVSVLLLLRKCSSNLRWLSQSLVEFRYRLINSRKIFRHLARIILVHVPNVRWIQSVKRSVAPLQRPAFLRIID